MTDGARAIPRLQQVRLPAGAARRSARPRRAGSSGASASGSIRRPRRCRSSAPRKGCRTCRSRWSTRATSRSCPSRATRRTSAAPSWPAPSRTSRRSGRRTTSCSSWSRCPEAVLRRAKLVFVNYPNNPTAAVATPGVPRADGGRLPPPRHPAGVRQRVLRADLRRLSGAEHLRDRRGARGGDRVLLALEELLDDRLADRLRGRAAGADRRADPGQVVRGHRAVPRGPEGRRRRAGPAPRRWWHRSAPSCERRRDAAVAALREAGFTRRVAQGGDVSLGAAARRHRVRGRSPRRALEETGVRGPARQRASARRAKGSSGSRSPSEPTGSGTAAGRLGQDARAPCAEERLRPPLDLAAAASAGAGRGSRIAASVAAARLLPASRWVERSAAGAVRTGRTQLIVLAPPGRRAEPRCRCRISRPRHRPGRPAAAAGRSRRVPRSAPRRGRAAAGGAQPRPGAAPGRGRHRQRRTGGLRRPAAIGIDRSRPGGGPALGPAAAAAAQGAGAAAAARAHAELVDSAVTATVQAYLDSIAADPASQRRQRCRAGPRRSRARNSGWTRKNIYVAGLKIPAAVLALLPIPAGNIDQNRAYNHSDGSAGRPSVRRAAARPTWTEFKRDDPGNRGRKEREREFERNQRTAPPPDDAATP